VGADLGRGLEAGAAHGEVDALGERNLQPVGGVPERLQQRRVVGVAQGRKASSFGPTRRFTPVRLMWSVMAISRPGPTSGRREPAAFVRMRTEAPAARRARTGTRRASGSPPS